MVGIFNRLANIFYTNKNEKYWQDVAKSYTETTSRPAMGSQAYMPTDTGAKLPVFPFPLIMIYEIARNVDGLRIAIETLNIEMFKNGFEIIEKFKYKCTNCFKEFNFKPVKEDDDMDKPTTEKSKRSRKKTSPKRKAKEILECDSCGSRKLIRPVPEHRKILENLYTKSINNNEQTLEDVSRMLERDLEIADNAYMLILKNYNINDSTGKINWDKTKIKEIMTIDPPQVALISDSDGRIGFDDKRLPVYVCPHFEHREKRLTTPYCNRHEKPVEALKAIMEASSIYSVGIPQPKRVIYAEGEVLWKSGKYWPNLLYGYSPVYSIWQKVMSLTHMDEYVKKYFDKMRPPRGLLVVASRNYETFQKAWNLLEERATEDPYRIHPLMVEAEKGGRNMAQWIDFTGSLRELQFMDVRREFRQIIGACFDNETEVFTENGWKKFEDLDNDELVAQVDNELGIEFVKPEMYHEYDWNGDLLHFKTKSLDAMVTPNHKMVMQPEGRFYSDENEWELRDADKVKRCVMPQAIRNWKGKEIEEFILPEDAVNCNLQGMRLLQSRKFGGDDFCKFMGIYLSEGNYESSKKYHKVQISQSKSVYPENYNKIEQLMKKLPFNYYKLKDNKFIINSSQLNEYLEQFGHSGDKYVPDIIKNTTPEQIRIFLDWYVMGDGSMRYNGNGKNMTERILTKSERMADDLQELYMKIGISATKAKTKEGFWRVDSRVNKLKNEKKYYSCIRSKHITRKPYRGKVYCVQVPSRRIIVRRNGKILICGNCYGVLPLYFGEMPGGWNQEGMQVTITNRRVKWGQDFLCKNFFDRLTYMMGIEDWQIRLKPGEEADELRELSIEAQKIQNAKARQDMGFDVGMTHSGEWKFSKEVKNPPMMGAPNNEGGVGRGDSLTGNKERTKPQQGQPFRQRPSDETGSNQGHPTPPGPKGSNFNQSEKSDKSWTNNVQVEHDRTAEGLEDANESIRRLKEELEDLKKELGHD